MRINASYSTNDLCVPARIKRFFRGISAASCAASVRTMTWSGISGWDRVYIEVYLCIEIQYHSSKDMNGSKLVLFGKLVVFISFNRLNRKRRYSLCH